MEAQDGPTMPVASAKVVDDSAQGPTPKFGIHANPPVSFCIEITFIDLRCLISPSEGGCLWEGDPEEPIVFHR